MDLKWNYDERWVEISLDGYVRKALRRFQHETPNRQQHAPHKWSPPNYGSKVQCATEPDESPPLDKDEIKRLKEIIGVFLFYARAVDNTMLVALGTLGAAQAQGTRPLLPVARRAGPRHEPRRAVDVPAAPRPRHAA